MTFGFIGLVKVELPNHTAHLTDGGFCTYEGVSYTSFDSLIGSLAFIENMTEGKSGEIPAIEIGFNIPNTAAISMFTSGALQESQITIWQGKYDVDTGLIIGTPDLKFIGLIDQPRIPVKAGQFVLSLTCVSKLETFFQAYSGNTLCPSYHKCLWPNETGHDNANGLSVATAWGANGPVTGGGGGSGGGGNIHDGRSMVLH